MIFVDHTEVLEKILYILEYLIDVDRGLTIYDTDYLRKLMDEARGLLYDQT